MMDETRFRIELDPQCKGRWQFVDLRRGQSVGGFRSAKDARRAFERERRETEQ